MGGGICYVCGGVGIKLAAEWELESNLRPGVACSGAGAAGAAGLGSLKRKDLKVTYPNPQPRFDGP